MTATFALAWVATSAVAWIALSRFYWPSAAVVAEVIAEADAIADELDAERAGVFAHQRQKQIHRDRVKRAGVGVGVHFHKGGK